MRETYWVCQESVTEVVRQSTTVEIREMWILQKGSWISGTHYFYERNSDESEENQSDNGMTAIKECYRSTGIPWVSKLL